MWAWGVVAGVYFIFFGVRFDFGASVFCAVGVGGEWEWEWVAPLPTRREVACRRISYVGSVRNAAPCRYSRESEKTGMSSITYAN